MAIERNSQTRNRNVHENFSIKNSSLNERDSGYREEKNNEYEPDVYGDYEEDDDQTEDNDAEDFFYGEFYEFENDDLDEPQSRIELRRSKRAKRNLRKNARSTTNANR